jgi:hypothetical protein
MLLIFASCSNDQDDVIQNSGTISGYKITTETNYDDAGNNDYKRVIVGNLVNGKLYSTTTTYYENNTIIGSAETVQRYFYTNDLLTEIHPGGNYYDNYYYDSQSRLIGAKRTYDNGDTTLNYRFVYQNNATVYCERLDLPYDDPSTAAVSRMILNFDSNDNVISAGFDNDFDGVISDLYTYFYTNGNMTSKVKPNGEIETYDSSNVVDSYYALAEHSYGKKVLRLICSESYCGGSTNYLDLDVNVKPQYLVEYDYQTLSNNFYIRKSKTEVLTSPSGESTYEMEFFFN